MSSSCRPLLVSTRHTADEELRGRHQRRGRARQKQELHSPAPALGSEGRKAVEHACVLVEETVHG
jgi:hypothetical protein